MVCLAVDLSKDKYSIYSYKMDTLSDRRRSAMIVSEAKKIGMQIQIARKKRQLSQAVKATGSFLSAKSWESVIPKATHTFSRDGTVGIIPFRNHEEIVDCGKPERSASWYSVQFRCSLSSVIAVRISFMSGTPYSCV